MARNVGINSTFEQQRLVINEIAVDVETLQNAAESDPVFIASVAAGITNTNINNWNTAYGWGDHSIVGYTTITGVGTDGSINTTGVITASSFSGSASGLTNIPSGQLTGPLPAIDGSALLNVSGSGSGVEVQDSGTPVGTAGTIDFGANLTVSPVSAGVVTVTASGGGGTSYWVETASGIHTLSNVGIGTTNPTSKLDIYGSVTISGNGFLYDSVDSNYYFRPTNWQLKGGGYITTSNTVDGYIQIGEKYIYGIDTVTGGDFNIQSNGNSYFRGGNLGVGTATATSKLTVEGDGRFSGVVTATRFESSSAGTPTIDSPNNLNINAVTVAISTDLTVGGDAYVGIDTSSGLVLTSPNGTTYRLVVDNSGVLSTVLVS